MFLHLAFRPFFLIGSFVSIILMGLWLAFLVFPSNVQLIWNPVYWHAHEMIFGFAMAIISGFLLTAIQNWTGIRSLNGKKLGFLVLLWILGRLVLLMPQFPKEVAMIVDLSFYPVLALVLIPFYRKDPELTVEKVFFLFIALYFLGNLLVHLDGLGWFPGHARQGLFLGMNTTLVMIVFMGGRVIPFFTESNIARKQPKTFQTIEIGCVVSSGSFLVSHTLFPESFISGSIGLLAGIFHLIRLWGWQVPRVRRIPLIWVLHVAYLWIVIGYFLSFFSGLGFIPTQVAIHAFTVGGIGMMIFGMISRVSLGHTGRRLHPHFATVVGYFLILGAALFRVVGVWYSKNSFGWASEISSVLWILGFCIFVWIYFPILVGPRLNEHFK